MTVDPGPPRGPGDFRRIAVEVVWLVRFFYLFVFFLMNTHLGLHRYLSRGDPTDPVWPAALLNGLLGPGWAEAAYDLPVIPVASAVLGILAMVFPGCLIWRFGIFLYLFFTVALINSYGSISHGGHFLVYVSFALLFLPAAAGRPDRMPRSAAMNCIRTFWFAQFIPLFCYSLAGLWKVLFSGPELLTSDSFVRILLNRVMSDTSSMPLLLPYVVRYEHLSQFLLLGVVYLEVCAVFAWFRPHLHRPFGVMLILFHLGVGWLLNIFFIGNLAILGIFMVFSPFSPRRSSWFTVAQSLPLLGIPFRIGARRRKPGLRTRRAWLVYDGECPVCKRYARHLDVGDAIGDLVLVDARDGGALVEEIENLPCDPERRHGAEDGRALLLRQRSVPHAGVAVGEGAGLRCGEPDAVRLAAGGAHGVPSSRSRQAGAVEVDGHSADWGAGGSRYGASGERDRGIGVGPGS